MQSWRREPEVEVDGRTRRLPLACIPPPSPSPPSPPPPPRHGLRGGLRSCACALELERSGVAAAPGTPRSPASHGGGAGRRLRGGETAGLARSVGLKLGPWRRQPDLVASTSGYSVGRALLELRRGQAARWSSGHFGAPSTSPSGPTAMAGARARTWRGADPRQAARRSGGGGAGAGAAGGAD